MTFRLERPAGDVTHSEPTAAPPALVAIPQQRPAVEVPTSPAVLWTPPRQWSPVVAPPFLPPQPRRSFLWPVLTALLVTSMLLALAGASAAAVALRGDRITASTAWVDMQARPAALGALLDRRAKAVLAGDPGAFLADVDPADQGLVKRERQLFDNMAKIPFSALSFQLEAPRPDLQRFLPANLRDTYHEAAEVAAVDVIYKIKGIDSVPVATPWLPIVAYAGSRWEIVGEATGKDLPYGANGQAWDDAGPIIVQTSPRVVAVLSADDAERGPYLLQYAEKALDRLAQTRSGGWDGKVFLTAVQDQRIFDTYFADSPERIAQVAAIAVPYYDKVPDWNPAASYTATRIVFNPRELSAQPDVLAHDLTHEFTHAAMGPVTTGMTPRWLVEGFAEYSAYNGTTVDPAWIDKALGDLSVTGGLPSDAEFYQEPRNYVVAWLACRMIAEKYGKSKLIALYEAFQKSSDVDHAIETTLGTDRATLESKWRDYVAAARG
jgi:hypothetical protein